MVCYLDQSTRLDVQTVYFREDRSSFPEIAAVHVTSVQVRHLPVHPAHLTTPDTITSLINNLWLRVILVGAELQRIACRVRVIQPYEDSGRVGHLILQNLPEVSRCWNVSVVIEKYFLIVVVRVFEFKDPVSSSVDLYLPS